MCSFPFFPCSPDISIRSKPLPSWLSQLRFSKLRQPTGQRLSNVRTQQRKIPIWPILFLYHEESLLSSNLNSKQLRFHPNIYIHFSRVAIATAFSRDVTKYFLNHLWPTVCQELVTVIELEDKVDNVDDNVTIIQVELDEVEEGMFNVYIIGSVSLGLVFAALVMIIGVCLNYSTLAVKVTKLVTYIGSLPKSKGRNIWDTAENWIWSNWYRMASWSFENKYCPAQYSICLFTYFL